MPGFDDLRQRYLEYLDPTALAADQGDETGYALPRVGGQAQAKQAALAEIAPETQGYGTRLLYGAMGDLKDLGQGLFGLGSAAIGEGARFLSDPVGRTHAYEDTLAPIAEHPLTSLLHGAEALGEGMIAPYRPQEGEGALDVIKRAVLDHPIRTGMDLAAVVGGPAELAAKLGLPGAAAVARGVSAADPINATMATLRGGGRALEAGANAFGMTTGVPDAIARLHANSIIADQAAEATTRHSFLKDQFAQQVQSVFSGLDDTEKTMFFPYVEGRLKAMSPESGMAGQVAELSPATGQWTPNSLDPQRLARLENARQAYLPIVDQFEQAAGYAPEQASVAAGLSKQRELLQAGADPLHPDSIAQIQHASQEAGQQAQEAQRARRTVSTRTALTVAKTQKFQEEMQRIELEQGADAATQFASQYPVQPATPEEALSVMGPQGALYFPHSGEVFTKDLSTIGNVLTKVRESTPWKQNTGALIRSGALDTMDPEKALMRTFTAISGGKGFSEIADAVGRQMGTLLEPGHAFGTDPELRAGTHQLLRPGLLHQEGALTEQVQELAQKLLAHGDDPAVQAMNLHDLVAQAAGQMDTNFPLRTDAPIYKIPKAAGDALKAFQKSFEPPTNPFTKFLDATADPFNFVTLNLRPARILNNVVGNTIFQVMQGIHPFSTTGIGAMADMAQAVGSKLGVLGGERAAKLAKVFDLPGVAGGLSKDLASSATGSALAQGRFGLPGRMVAGYAEKMMNFNQHVEASARALSTLFELRKADPEQWASALSTAKHTIDTGDIVDHLASQGVNALDDAGYKQALGNVNKFLNDYNRSTPTERTMWRRIFPYEKFYRHAINLALTAPFDAPTQTTLLRSIGTVVQNDMHERLRSFGFDPAQLSPSMQDSIPIDAHDDPERGRQVRMLNLQGPNPFSVLSASDPGEAGLGAVHPFAKTIIEDLTGVNLFTRDRFQGALTTFSGKAVQPDGSFADATVRPGPISRFSQQFFPVAMMRELIANGRTPFDDASLKDMVMASASGQEGHAFRVNARGVAERRPYSPLDTLARMVGPVPKTLEMPTRSQATAEAGGVSDEFNRVLRTHPELADKLLALLDKKSGEVQPRELPYRPE